MKKIEADLLERKEELEITSTRLELRMGRRNHGEVSIYFGDIKKDGLTTPELHEEVKAILPKRPGFTYRYGHRRGRGGQTSGIEIILKGERMELLEDYAGKVVALMEGLPGIEDMDLSTEQGEQEVRILIDRERASATGISANDVARSVSSQLSSRPNTRYKAADREVNVMVGLAEEDRLNLSRLGTMEMFSGTGQRM